MQNEDFEDQDEIVSWVAAMLFRLGRKDCLEFQTEVFSVDDFVQTGKTIAKNSEAVEAFLFVKVVFSEKSKLLGIVAYSSGFMFILLIRLYFCLFDY